jgi:hypothetical protein
MFSTSPAIFFTRFFSRAKNFQRRVRRAGILQRWEAGRKEPAMEGCSSGFLL